MSFFVDPAQPHLGGYKPGGDPATYYPVLWTWLVKEFGIKSVIDVGAGDGVAVDYFWKLLEFDPLNAGVVGIEGTRQEHDLIFQHDYTLGWPAVAPADLVWCCEFVEHVEERFVPNFLDTFKRAKFVLLTHAEPGQGGYNHVNCQPQDYWVGAMAAIGYSRDNGLAFKCRELASENKSAWNHFKRSGLAFVRN